MRIPGLASRRATTAVGPLRSAELVAGTTRRSYRVFWSSGAAPDAMVDLVGIHVISSGFVREMFFLIS
jgi:hypothetical protein